MFWFDVTADEYITFKWYKIHNIASRLENMYYKRKQIIVFVTLKILI